MQCSPAGKCLANIGVSAMDSRDALRRGRFFPFVPQDHLFPNKDRKFWYWSYIYYPSDEVSGELGNWGRCSASYRVPRGRQRTEEDTLGIGGVNRRR